MTEHVKLLKDARKIAAVLDDANFQEPDEAVDMLRTLADLVEHQDKVIAETVAACRRCATEIDNVVKSFGSRAPAWMKLSVAAHFAVLAAKLVEPKGSDAGKLSQAERDALMELATGTPNQPAYDEALSPEVAAAFERGRKAIRSTPVYDSEKPEPPAPPVKIEMRVRRLERINMWIWQCYLGDVWCEPGVAVHRLCQTIKSNTRINAEEWLAALRRQLGVPLVAVWEEGE